MSAAAPIPGGFRHLTFNLVGDLRDNEKLRAAFICALAKARATILEVSVHEFQPEGLTLVALLAESHASLHSWPELGFAMCDFFTCSPRATAQFDAFLLELVQQGYAFDGLTVSQRHPPCAAQ